MANIIDYVREYGIHSFMEKPFNEVDALILSQFVYMNLGPFVPGLEERNVPVTVSEIYEHPDRDRILDDYWYKQNNQRLFEEMVHSRRFGTTKLNYYVNVINEKDETQFSAVTFVLADKTVFIAYRGTDATIIGWKEDLNLAFSKPLSSQYLSVEYMNRVSSWIAGGFYAGGHSKGGNLAVYAAMNCSERAKEKLIHVYNNDGPGFRPEIRKQGQYEKMADRISKFVPKSSIVGMILEDHGEFEIIESSGVGLLQHNAYSWKIEENAFVRAGNMSSSKVLRDAALNEWILTLSDEEKHLFIDTLYEVISASQASNVFELGANLKQSMQNIYEAVKEVDEPTKKAIQNIIRKLIELTVESVWK